MGERLTTLPTSCGTCSSKEDVGEVQTVSEGTKKGGRRAAVQQSRARDPKARTHCGRKPVVGVAVTALSIALPDPPVFLEIFAGSARLAKAECQVTSWPVLMWDISLGPDYDLLLRKHQWKIVGYIRANRVRALHLRTPCTSFSRARDRRPGPPPLRSNECPLGLPGLSAKDQQKVKCGNVLIRFSARILMLCGNLFIPGTLENPAMSRLWLCKATTHVLRRRFAQQAVCDFCQFGTPWKKPTRFAGVHIDLGRLAQCRCQGAPRGFCSRTGSRHVPLVRQHPSGKWLTQIAEPYPKKLARLLANCFWQCKVKNKANNIERHFVPESY